MFSRFVVATAVIVFACGLAPGDRYVVAVESDTQAQDLAERFGNRFVWTRAGITAVCADDSTGGVARIPFDTHVEVEDIVRVPGLRTDLTSPSVFGGSEHYPMTVVNPVVVTIVTPRAALQGRNSCARSTLRFAGAWDFERIFRLKSMHAAHPNWTPAVFAELAVGRIHVGMTHAMVAEMLGYPPMLGSIGNLERMQTWEYWAPGPFGCTVYFHGDRVVAYDPPGELP